MKAKTFVFTGPSAVGKTYIGEQLVRLHSKAFKQSKLYTTRSPRLGEPATDRLFVSSEKFESMVKNGDFLVHDEFGGNFYGFTRESLYSNDKHLIVNIWPGLVPLLATYEHIVIVGMQSQENFETQLITRMQQRGDSEETIHKRLILIKNDITDLAGYKDIISEHGKFFVIKDNQTIPKEIIPWIEGLLGDLL